VIPGRILLTGGTGRLGCELRSLLSGVIAPSRAELDISRPEMIEGALRQFEPQVLVHTAAYTDVAGAERDRQTCWRVNVHGTRAVVQSAAHHGVFLVHISTDYVFEGTRGMYSEEDPPGPVRNYYALSKLVAEEVVRLTPRHLILRTSFRPREWPYPVAFADVHTSQDYVDVIAPEIALAIQRCREIPYSTLHIATERKSVYDLARRRRPEVRPGSKREASVALPDDISLDTSRWQALKARWGGAGKL
jgi:dTDP-4-dehydrorhamnose reductase